MGKTDGVELWKRVLAAAVFGPLVLAAIYFDGSFYNAFIMVLGMLGMREWLRMTQKTPSRLTRAAAYGSTSIIIIAGLLLPIAWAALGGIVLMLILFVIAARKDWDVAGWIAFGIPYLAGSCLALLYLRNGTGAGADGGQIGMGLTYFLVLTVWGTDVGAYAAGKLIGGAKLVPQISPSKTWAGLFGGVFCAVLAGYAVANAFGVQNPLVAILLAALLAVVSQLGDLFESYIKRRAGMKDSGGIIPGHGGLLDRVDGLVFAASFFVLFQVMVGTELSWW